MSVFVDTGVFYGALHAPDRNHNRSLSILDEIRDGGPFTTDHILVETWLLMQRKLGWDVAMRFWRSVRHTPIQIEFVTAADLERAAAIADQWTDQSFSLVDCTSFAVMERTGCTQVAAFDADFAIYRYGPDGKRAFTIIR